MKGAATSSRSRPASFGAARIEPRLSSPRPDRERAEERDRRGGREHQGAQPLRRSERPERPLWGVSSCEFNQESTCSVGDGRRRERRAGRRLRFGSRAPPLDPERRRRHREPERRLIELRRVHRERDAVRGQDQPPLEVPPERGAPGRETRAPRDRRRRAEIAAPEEAAHAREEHQGPEARRQDIERREHRQAAAARERGVRPHQTSEGPISEDPAPKELGKYKTRPDRSIPSTLSNATWSLPPINMFPTLRSYPPSMKMRGANPL